MTGPKLTSEQIAQFKAAMVQKGTPVRFLHQGGALNIISGEVQPCGINVIHQVVYWNFTRETAKRDCEGPGRQSCVFRGRR